MSLGGVCATEEGGAECKEGFEDVGWLDGQTHIGPVAQAVNKLRRTQREISTGDCHVLQ